MVVVGLLALCNMPSHKEICVWQTFQTQQTLLRAQSVGTHCLLSVYVLFTWSCLSVCWTDKHLVLMCTHLVLLCTVYSHVLMLCVYAYYHWPKQAIGSGRVYVLFTCSCLSVCWTDLVLMCTHLVLFNELWCTLMHALCSWILSMA